MPLSEPAVRAESVAADFAHMSRRAGAYAPVMARLAQVCAADSRICTMAAAARPGQNAPSLLLGAVHYLLARSPGHPLAHFYATLSADPVPDLDHDDPGPEFRSFAYSHRTEITALVSERLVQTHEVGRCAYLYPALLAVQRHAGRPLAAIEIGPSAGLTLVPDRYAYEYATGRHYGDTSSPLTLNSRFTGPARPDFGEPLTIAWRAGIDLNPLNLDDAEDRAWLRALVWPDHPERAQRLDTALAAARRGPIPTLHAGDAAAAIGTVADAAPEDAALVVYHTAVTAHFTPAMREQWTQRLLELSRARPVRWLRAEPHEEPRLRFSALRDGNVAGEVLLGSYHPHGAWVHWDTGAA